MSPILQSSTIADLLKTKQILLDRISAIDALLLEFSSKEIEQKVEKIQETPKPKRAYQKTAPKFFPKIPRKQNLQDATEAVEIIFSSEPHRQSTTKQIHRLVCKLIGRNLKPYTIKRALTDAHKNGKITLLGARLVNGVIHGGNGSKWTGASPQKPQNN